jgi:virulence factor Mce-like protein
MRRAALALTAGGLAAVVLLLVLNGSSGDYRVAAIFDDAKGMVSGQQVKIAGAVVGSVQAVDLSAGPKARMVLLVDRRFAPFHTDATCSIKPEGLISENYVDCNPGSASKPAETISDGLPTVPLTRTTVPISLQDVLNVFALPTDQRLGVLLDELGIATAGRGEDINGLLRRSNPALQQTQQALQVLDTQRTRLTDAISQSSAVMQALAGDRAAVRGFVDHAAAVLSTTAAHRAALQGDVAQLPGLLAASQPALRSIDHATRSATSLLGELHLAAPGMVTLTQDLPSFTHAGVPAVRTLGATSAVGASALHDATPAVAQLLRSTGPLQTAAPQIEKFLASLRDTGGFEGLLRFTYSFASSLAPEDNLGHFLTILAGARPDCIAAEQANLPDYGCAKKFSAAGGGELPVNDPSCGPKSGSWYDQVCPGAAPGPIALQKGESSATYKAIAALVNQSLTPHPPQAAKYRALLRFLLR